MLSILLAITTIIGIVLVVLLLFVLGKLNWLENATNSMLEKIDVFPATKIGIGSDQNDETDPYFYGLTGKKLWNCLTEPDDSDLSPQEIDEIRPRYSIVLVKALSKFILGEDNEEEYLRNIRTVKTTRGKIDIWLPSKVIDSCENISSKISELENINVNEKAEETEKDIDLVEAKKELTKIIEQDIETLIDDLVKKTKIKYNNEMSSDLLKIIF
jgi:hypothetical protein